MEKKKPNIKDVAKLAKVHPTTVSAYLNKTAPIHPGTAKRIENAIGYLNYDAVKYLIDNGHRDIYYFTEPPCIDVLKDRLEGYRAALTDNDIEVDKSKIVIDERLQIKKPQQDMS